MKRKLFTFLVAIVASIGLTCAEVYSGTCGADDGSNLTWSLNTEDSTLVISGTGAMIDWSYSTSVPWNSYRSYIAHVTIGNSVTSIGDYAFYNCSSLTLITIPNSVTSIGYSAFYGCSGLISVTIPNSVTSIGAEAFFGCINLTSVTIPNNVKSIYGSTFYNCRSLISVTIPNSVTSIGGSAFFNCRSLASVTIPSSVKSIGDRAFSNCGLTSVTIPNNVTNIGDNAFYNCNSLTKVNISDLSAWCNINFSNYSANPLCCAKHLFLNDEEIIDLVIPSDITNIKNYTFYGCSGLTSVTIPKRVTSIGTNAFSGCSNLVKVTINSNSIIGEDFSYNSSTQTSNNIKNIFGTQVQEYIIGDDVTRIGDNAFYQCANLKSITIGKGVTIIGAYAFTQCNNVTSVIWNAQKCSRSWNFGNQVESFVFGNSVNEIPSSLCRYMNKISTIAIPASVTSIGDYTFAGCSSLTSIDISNSVKSIGKEAFSLCSISEVHYMGTIEEWLNKQWQPSQISNNYALYIDGGLQANIIIPNSVTSIGDYAFEDCSSLISVVIPNSVTSIGSSAFRNDNNLTSATIPNSITSIGHDAFAGCSFPIADNLRYIDTYLIEVVDQTLTTYTIKEGTKWITDGVFSGCSNMTSITIPSSITNIGDEVFFECGKLKSVALNSNDIVSKSYSKESNITSIFGTQIEEYIIGDGVSSIGEWAFYGSSSLSSLAIPNSVTSIGRSAFSGCSDLISITIPENLTSIGQYAFNNCKNIISVVWNAQKCNSWNFGSQVESFVFGDNVKEIPASICRYMNKISSITIPACVKKIGDNAFEDCSSLTSVSIPNSITSIGECAFMNCNSLSSVTIPDSVTIIEKNTFSGCSGLTSLTIGNSVTIINGAFRGCSRLTSVTLPNKVTSIGDWAFQNCSNLSSINIPNGVTNIGKMAFQNCSSLPSLYIGNKVASISNSTFSGCSSLTSIDIPNSVTSIGEKAFLDCSKLDTISLGTNISTYGDSAFAGCPKITTIYNYSQRPARLGKDVFKDVDYFNSTLYVLAGSVDMYKSSGSDWKDFYFVEPMGAEQTNAEDEKVIITPTDNTAKVKWPAVENAATYELTIKDKNGNVICTLVFNAQGQLTSIAFAAPIRTQTAAQVAGFTFTVTGLDSGSEYSYSIAAKDSQGVVLDTKSGTFTTTGDTATALENASLDTKLTKVLRNGQLFILRDGNTYTIQGQEVR